MAQTVSQFTKKMLLILFGIFLGAAIIAIAGYVRSVDFEHAATEAWEQGDACKSFELTLMASAFPFVNHLREVGGFYTRGECVRQDFTVAMSYYERSGINDSSAIASQLVVDALMLSQDEAVLNKPEISENLRRILKEAKELGAKGAGAKEKYKSEKVYQLFLEQLGQ